MNKSVHQIYYKNRKIGTISIRKINNKTFARFSTIDSINNTLEYIGAHKFNWFQICCKDNHPPFDLSGNQVNVPYIDPYPCGYALEGNKNFIYWNDGHPWYWDVSSVKTYKNFDGLYDITCTLSYNMDKNNLYFVDMPNLRENSELEFETSLVCLDENNNLIEKLFTFSWSVKNDNN